MSVDPRQFRDCCGRFATGVTVITTAHGDQVHGMTANAFMSVSLEPPMVVVSIARRARTHELMSASQRFGVSVLGEEQEPLAQHFAGRPQPGLQVAYGYAGELPLLQGALAHLVCTTVNRVAAGDHTLFVGAVEWTWHREGPPLLFFEGRLFGMEGRPLDPGAAPLPSPLEPSGAPAPVPPQGGHTLVADYP